MPTLLTTFVKWVLLGRHNGDSDFVEASLADGILRSTTQFVSQNMKSSRQTKYHLEKGKYMVSSIETPLNIAFGLYIYHTTRSKKLINFLSH